MLKKWFYLFWVTCFGISPVMAFAEKTFTDPSPNVDSAPHSLFDRTHGINIFGTKNLKYITEDSHFATTNPNAPKGGTLNLSWPDAFTKKNPLSLGGAPMPGYWLCFEALAEVSYDDDDDLSAYGLLAEWVEIATDRQSMLIKLRENIYFSDGQPMTADDVVFSWDIAQDPAYLPSTRILLKDIETFDALDSRHIRVNFKTWNRELPMTVLTTLYILPKHIYGRPGTDFGKDFNNLDPVGSGPYGVEKSDPSSFVTWKRNTHYWGRHLWLMRGRYNFDYITYKFFTESRTVREAFLAGNLDVIDVNSARDWAEELNPQKNQNIARHYIKPFEYKSTLMPPIQAFAFNTRRAVFQDIRVRKAIASVFDFESLSKNLFFDAYTRQKRFYESPEMRTKGPAKDSELKILLDLRERYNCADSNLVYVPKSAITTGMRQMGYDLKGKPLPLEERVFIAGAYLDAAGWIYDPVEKVRKKDGIPLQFEILLAGTDGSFVRVVSPFFDTLKALGIRTSYKEAQIPEYAERVNKYDYDMIVTRFYASKSPGVELGEYWHSTAADAKGSRNYCGVKNPAIDEIVTKIVQLEDRQQTNLYAKVLDRLLWNQYYIITQWYSPYNRGATWNKFSKPLHTFGQMRPTFNAVNFWWYDESKDKSLKASMKKRESFIETEKE